MRKVSQRAGTMREMGQSETATFRVAVSLASFFGVSVQDLWMFFVRGAKAATDEAIVLMMPRVMFPSPKTPDTSPVPS
jgi:hypothetical protein